MNIASYLAQQRAHLQRRSTQVKDFSIFDFHHIPDEPVLRNEANLLIDELLQFDLSGIPTHLAIIGSRGSGKTLTVKYLQRVLPQHVSLDFLYANCRHYNTSFKIFAHLLGIQARGTSMSEVFERFCASFRKKTVVVLDEIDLMSVKESAKGDSLSAQP